MRFLSKLSILIAFALTGCGFHLRGVVDADSLRWLNNVAIVIQLAHRDLEPLLRSQLKSYNVNVVSDPAFADYWLILENEDMQQNITSISSSTTPRQYELTYTLDFKLQRAKGAEIIPSNRIMITRQITLNSDRILGSKEEEQRQKIEMRRDAVIQIINRLSHASRQVITPNTKMLHSYVN